MAVLLAAAAAAVIYLVHYIISYYRYVARFPRGPTPLPLVGNLMSYDSKTIHQHFDALSKEFGPVFTLFIPVPMVVITGHAALKEAFVIKGEDYANRPTQNFDDQLAFCENGGVINSNGDAWRENRRQAISILRDFGMGKGLMEEKVKLSILEYLRYLEQIKDKSSVDMRWPVQGQRIPPGTLINGDLYSVHKCDPLFKDPEEFRPERYLNEDGKTLNKDALDRTVPFSLGKRACAGEGLARVELLLGLAATLQRYRVLPTRETPLDLTPFNNIVILPKQQPLRLEPL